MRDLAHVQSLARADMLSGNGSSLAHDPPIQQAVKYEISGMPIGDIIEMVAALLTKITTTNDMRHDANHRNAAHQQHAASHNDGTSPQMSPLSTSVLAFHGKNVPAITILSYLSRIHKYCPTTYEVFLSLLVYFDRMTERVNAMVVKSEQERLAQAMEQQRQQMVQEPKPPGAGDEDVSMEDESDDLDSDLADDDDAVDRTSTGKAPAPAAQPAPPGETRVAPVTQPMVSTYFVVDSYNIHRLIIAGVTCASKFFSDVFYTNSRYAKVGTSPLMETTIYLC